jgi:hypothetical protein
MTDCANSIGVAAASKWLGRSIWRSGVLRSVLACVACAIDRQLEFPGKSHYWTMGTSESILSPKNSRSPPIRPAASWSRLGGSLDLSIEREHVGYWDLRWITRPLSRLLEVLSVEVCGECPFSSCTKASPPCCWSA